MMYRIFIAIISTIAPCVVSAQISMDEYCERVVAYSHELQDAQYETQGARERELVARKDYLPLFDLMREVNVDMRTPSVGRRWNWLTRLDVSQPIFRGGGVRAEAKRAELVYDIAQLNHESVRLFTIYTAQVTYWALSRAENNYDAMCYYVTIVRSLRDVVEERFREGYISKSDLLQVESRLSDAEYQLSNAKQQLEIARHNFNVLMGLDPMSQVSISESILVSVDMPVREGVESILARHPDIESSRLNIEHAFWGVRAVQANYLPQIEVGVYGLFQPNTPHTKGGGSRLDGGLLISFSTPIYHFGQRKHAVSAARSDYLRRVNAQSSVVDRITLDESDTWTNLTLTHERVATAQRNLAIAQENLEISTYAYSEGLVTILDVLQAQLSWLQIYNNAIAAQYDYAVAVAAYDYITCKSLR